MEGSGFVRKVRNSLRILRSGVLFSDKQSMFRWLGSALLFYVFLFGKSAQAGPLEQLSKSAFYLSGNRCDSFDEKNAEKVVETAAKDLCFTKQTVPAGEFRELKRALKEHMEGNLFAMLAEQQVLELGCAQDFAKLISSGAPDKVVLDGIQTKLNLARIAKQNLARASQKLATDPNVTSRICPMQESSVETTLASLNSEFPPEQRNSETYRLCHEIMVNRQAYLSIVSTIPLSGTEEVQKYIDNYVTAKTVPPDGDFRSAYKAAGKSLRANAVQITDTLRKKGGQGLTRRDRHMLLDDPALQESIIQKLPESSRTDIRGLLCQANAQYGKGADALDTGIMIGSMAVSGGVGMLGRSSAVMSKAAPFAAEARISGMVSYYSMRALQYAGVAVQGMALATAVDRACGDHILPGIKTEGACTSAPSVSKIPQDDCILMASLSAMGYASLVPPGVWSEARLVMASTVAKVTSRIEKNSNAESIQSAIWAKRASGDLEGAKKLEGNLAAVMSDQKIVAVRAIGRGASRPYYVKFEDGTEGIWKRNTGWPSNGNAEIAAYKVDQELGTDFVAVTVPRSLNGTPGTVQVRITGLKTQTLEDFPDELRFFDYLLGNRDRHSDNYLQTVKGKLVPVDQGLAFSTEEQNMNGLFVFRNHTESLKNTMDSRKALEQELVALKAKDSSSSKIAEMEKSVTKMRRDESKLQSDVLAFMPDKKVVDKLRQTNLSRWQQILGKELTPGQIIELYERQKTLLQHIDDAEKLLGPDLIYRQGPVSPLLRENVPSPFLFKL